MLRLPFTFVAAIAFLTLSVRGEDPPQGPAFPPGVKPLYDALSTSMKTENMRGFMDLFQISFVYEGEDRASLDRGPWRRLWLDRFEDRAYEVVSFSPGEILQAETDRISWRVKGVAVFTDAADGAKQLEQVVFEDTLLREGGTWKFLERIRRGSNVGQVAPVAELRSPRLAALAASLKAGDETALGAFWAAVAKDGAPLVERDPDGSGQESKRTLVTFLWRGGRGEREVLVAGLVAADGRPPALHQLGTSDVWYLSVSLPGDARLCYEFHLTSVVEVAGPEGDAERAFTMQSTSTDPLNSRTVDELSVLDPQNSLSLPALDAVAGRPEGSLERETVRSRVLRERRFVSVYRPPSYDESSAPYPAVFLLDQGSYSSRQATRVLLDNLIAEKKIPAAVVFLIHSEGSRSSGLEASSRFVDFLGGELVEWARKTCHISEEPRDVVIGGTQLGATLAALCASRRPDVFGNVFAETGDFTVCVDPIEGAQPGCLPQRFSEIPKQELKFYLAVAALENERLVSSSWHLRDVLAAKSYWAPLVTLPRNHHSTTWLEALARGLEELLPGN
jgi:enterochelin esterase family protein